MNIDTKTILAKLSFFAVKVRRYAVVIFIVVMVGIYSFLVFRINMLNRIEPSSDDVAAKLQTLKRPKIDKSVVTKIQQLQDNSVEVQTLFKQARDNPFQE